jgi:hypothetical protein
MLEGIRSNEIIVGAYTGDGGICPMLAAHRAGGRTSFISFSRAWDRFAFRGARVRVARRATDRELLVLRTHLEASLLEDEGPAPDLAAAMAEHRELMTRREEPATRRRTPTARRRETIRRTPPARRPKSGSRPGDADRSRELGRRPGWAWMRVVRRYDDYERALDRLDAEHETLLELEREREPELV